MGMILPPMSFSKLLLLGLACAGDTPLLSAIEDRDLAAVRSLLASGVDPNEADASGEYPLLLATRVGSSEIAAALLDSGADIDVRDVTGSSCLDLCAYSDAESLADLFLRNGADASDSGGQWQRTPLHIAAQYDSHRVLDLLLKAGADIDARDVLGRSALHLAAESGSDRAIHPLVHAHIVHAHTRGKSWGNLSDHSGMTPLHLAAAFSRPLCLDVLSSGPRELNPRSLFGRTPLHWSCLGGGVSSRLLLLSRGASAHAMDEFGLTPATYLPAAPALEMVNAAAPCSGIEWQASSEEDPLVYLWQTKGYARPDFAHGLIAALWEDGKVLFAGDPSVPGEDLRLAVVPPSSLMQLRASLVELGLDRMSLRPALPMHSSPRILAFRSEGKVHAFEWASLAAFLFHSKTDDTVQRSFAEAVSVGEGLVRALLPQQSCSLEDDVGLEVFRGYSVRDPKKCPWPR